MFTSTSVSALDKLPSTCLHASARRSGRSSAMPSAMALAAQPDLMLDVYRAAAAHFLLGSLFFYSLGSLFGYLFGIADGFILSLALLLVGLLLRLPAWHCGLLRP